MRLDYEQMVDRSHRMERPGHAGEDEVKFIASKGDGSPCRGSEEKPG